MVIESGFRPAQYSETRDFGSCQSDYGILSDYVLILVVPCLYQVLVHDVKVQELLMDGEMTGTLVNSIVGWCIWFNSGPLANFVRLDGNASGIRRTPIGCLDVKRLHWQLLVRLKGEFSARRTDTRIWVNCNTVPDMRRADENASHQNKSFASWILQIHVNLTWDSLLCFISKTNTDTASPVCCNLKRNLSKCKLHIDSPSTCSGHTW